jgi:quinol-cytochrome oxidoreductase complex cytochrome b subunit
LLNFYALHISFIPMGIVILMSYHFWRVRKDGGLSHPRTPGEATEIRSERVTTIPHLVRRELVFAMVWLAIIIFWAMLVPAPLEGIANPEVSPNPAKAPWYFLGIQELLLHFHPLVGAIVIPAAALAALALLPYYDATLDNVGVYFRSRRGRNLSLLAAELGLILTAAWVIVDEYVLDWSGWLPTWPTLISDGIVPLALVLLVLVLLDEMAARLFHASREERILFLFVFIFTALIVLTLVGVFFRGPGMALYWPWAMPSHGIQPISL